VVRKDEEGRVEQGLSVSFNACSDIREREAKETVQAVSGNGRESSIPR